MPIAHDTLSHGHIPIGFFNIETDMFLIEDHFIFASDLCGAISDWTKGPDDIDTDLDFHVIEDRNDLGDLHGSIRGVVHTGFIGELYRLWPFPEAEEDFRQNPEGHGTRAQVEEVIGRYGKPVTVKVAITKREGIIAIGDYRFDRPQFHEVIAYIWRGGMPQWKDGRRPKYVDDMMKAVTGSSHWLFVAGE